MFNVFFVPFTLGEGTHARKNPNKFDPWSIFSRLNKGNASIPLYSLFKNLVFRSLIRTFARNIIIRYNRL